MLALAGQIANRADDIRIAALIALGHTGAVDKIDYVTCHWVNSDNLGS